MSRLRGALAVSLLVAGLALATAPTASARVHGLLTGFADFDAFQGDPADRAAAIQHLKDSRGSIVRVMLSWDGIEPQRPPSSAAARDPGWAGYDWGNADDIVRDLSAAGIRVFISFTAAPSWAEGPNRPPLSVAREGSWMPSATAYRDFAEAAARRYSGRFPDPARLGSSLPPVQYWMAWNEPNLTDYLAPQWKKVGSRFVSVSPGLYRSLLNAFYDGIKAVARDNFVVSAGTAPYGDPAGNRRMPPARFVRDLLCVNGRSHPRASRSCPGLPVKFDALAHNPYPIGPPRRHAPNPDDVVVPDYDRLSRPLDAAIRRGTVYPRRRKQLWATEISWDSSPPDPQGVPIMTHARYLTGALHILWQEGVQVVTWWHMRDDPVGQGYPFTLQSGVYYRGPTVGDDRPKPAFYAFRFPFTVYIKGGRGQIWGLAPGAGPVEIQLQSGSGWRTVARVSARGDRLFLGTLPHAHKKQTVRAVQGGEASLPWRVV